MVIKCKKDKGIFLTAVVLSELMYQCVLFFDLCGYVYSSAVSSATLQFLRENYSFTLIHLNQVHSYAGFELRQSGVNETVIIPASRERLSRRRNQL